MKLLGLILVVITYSRSQAQDGTSQPPTRPTQPPTQSPTQLLPTQPTQPATPPDDPCYLIDCMPGYHCVVSNVTGQGMCVIDPCAMLDCQWPQQCYINITTGRASCLTNPCSTCLWPRDCIFNRTSWTAKCVDDPCNLVDCLPHQYCVINATTGQGMCVNYSCAINNGRCRADQVCEAAVSGCQPGDRYCYRYTQCKDPPHDPPPIKPLPIVEPNTVLLSLRSDRMNREMFMQQRQGLLESIEQALSDQGHNVVARIHGVHFDDNQMQIVVELTGSGISSDSAETLVEALRKNSHLLTINIQKVDNVDADYIYREDSEVSQTSAITGIAVSSGVAGVAVIVAWIAVVTCCCVISARGCKSPLPPQEYKNQKFEFNEYSSGYPEEGEMGIYPEEGKMGSYVYSEEERC